MSPAGRTRSVSPLAAVACCLLFLASVIAPSEAPATAVKRPVIGVSNGVGGVIIDGLDLHDGTVVQVGNLYYLYGTQYGCGFFWGTPDGPFCGFGVSVAPSLKGPWSPPTRLFETSGTVPWVANADKTWSWVCTHDGHGCFNPRMVRRPDGQWMLWFNAPGDTVRLGTNAYYVLGCSGPTGPCGREAGPPYGFTAKPAMHACTLEGDFSIITQGSYASILCSSTGIYLEGLDAQWINGTGQVVGLPAPDVSLSTAREQGVTSPAYIATGEGVGATQLDDGTWIMTHSSPGCGYCTGPPADQTAGGATRVKTGYATAPTLGGPWTDQGILSATWCTGQPRTAFRADSQAYQLVDRWLGTPNETGAGLLLQPLSAAPGSWNCA